MCNLQNAIKMYDKERCNVEGCNNEAYKRTPCTKDGIFQGLKPICKPCYEDYIKD